MGSHNRITFSHKLRIKLRNPLVLICALLLITAFLEVFVFNFRFFTTLTNKPIELTPADAAFGDGIAFNFYDGSLSLNESGAYTVEFKDLDIKIDSVRFGIVNVNFNSINKKVNSEEQNVNVSFFVTDEANKLYYELPPSKDINRAIEKTQFAALHTSGKSSSLKIRINGQPGERFGIFCVILNPNRPFFFSPLRCLIAFLILLLFAVGASASYTRHIYNPKSFAQRIVTAAVAAAISVIFVMMILANSKFNSWGRSHYTELTDALLDGHVYLDAEPPQFLKEMDNPYDRSYRNLLAKEADSSTKWDFAYYNGKYYNYFGVFPAVLLNIPYKLITGEHLINSWSVCVFCVLFAIGAFLLMGAIIKRWFSSTSYFLYLLLTLCFIAISGVLLLLTRPSTYEVPIASALAFVIFALYFWVSAGGNERARNLQICLGSLCAALTVGCRPQFLLAAILAVPLLWAILTPNEKRGAWRERIPALAAFAVPFVVVGAAIMYYNYIRFESVFDFGAAYNLTTNDMTRRGFVAARIPFSLWKFFFQPANLTLEFPYVHETSTYTGFMIKSIVETTYGGVFNHIFLLLNVFIYKFRTALKDKKLFAFSIICVALAFVVGIFDAQYAGIVHRYLVDFSYLLFLPASVISLLIYENSGDQSRKYLRLFIILCLILSICFPVLPLAGETWQADWNAGEPNVYHTMKSAFEFWQ